MASIETDFLYSQLSDMLFTDVYRNKLYTRISMSLLVLEVGKIMTDILNGLLYAQLPLC